VSDEIFERAKEFGCAIGDSSILLDTFHFDSCVNDSSIYKIVIDAGSKKATYAVLSNFDHYERENPITDESLRSPNPYKKYGYGKIMEYLLNDGILT
jgi:hypothetical protein